MDAGNQAGKGQSKRGAPNQNDFATLQQQMALAAMGIVPGMLDSSALTSGANTSDADLQRLLAMQASGLPMMDSGALHAFSGMAGLPMTGMPPVMMPGNMPGNGNEWLAMAQQAQLLAGLGGGMPPQMLSQLYGANPILNSSTSQSGAFKDSKSVSTKVKMEPGVGASHPALTPSPSAHGHKDSSRPSSNTSLHRLTPSGMLSPGPSTTGRPSSKPRPHTSTSRPSNKDVKLNANPESQPKKQSETDQLLQGEMLRQLEQQFILQQLQLKQQQEQIEAALTVMNLPTGRQRAGTSQRQQNTSQSEKLQQRLSESIYQQLLSSNPYIPGMTPNMNSYFGSQQMLEQMLGMGQPSTSSSTLPKEKSSSQTRDPSYPSSNYAASSREKNKKIQNSRSSKDQQPLPTLDKSFPSNLLGGASSFPLTGDPNTDMYLAAIYSQMQGQGEAAKPGKSSSKRNQVAEKTSNFLSKEQNLQVSKAKDLSANLTNDASSRRRKQANPVSLNSLPETSLNSRRTPDGFSPQVTSSSNDVTHLEKKENNFKSSDTPLSLVRPKESSKSNSELTKLTDKNKLGNTATNSHTASKDKNKTASANDENINEKDLLMAVQALVGLSGQSESAASVEGLNLLLSAYSDALKGGESVDVNKVNELLTATVAAEMKRLQTQKVNLTKELEILSKNDHHNSSNSASRKQTPTPGKSSSDASLQHEGKVPRKRRRIISDEDEVMEPLRQGWDREVKLRKVGHQLRGEVFYHTPEGRKLRTYPEVLKYVEDHNITTLHRNNFSFSSKLKIGTFYEQKDDSKVWTKIPEVELDRHLGLMDPDEALSASASDDNQSASRRKRHARTVASNISIQQAIEEKLRKDEEREAELKMHEREQRKQEARLQREIKERQLLEERRKMEAARQLAKYQEAIRKEKEREERRHQLVFIKTLETKRRAEERDRRREEMKNERIYMREKKMEQRRLAMRLARELKMPVEDLCLTNHKPMTEMHCLQGTMSHKDKREEGKHLSGAATANVLMVLEFLYTFKEAIFIDESVIPSFEQLQRGLLNDPEHVGALVRLTMALLHQCLCDPGVPAHGPWLHCLIGVKVIDLDVGEGNYSEILRLFLWGRNGKQNEITDLLETEPFPSLSADQKAGVLASLVNELVCSKPVCDEIDKHLENLATLRRDKWIVEGKIRQARIEHANDGSDASTSSPLKSRSKAKVQSEEDKAEKEDSCKDDDSVTGDNKPTCRSDTVIERKMNKLTKEHQSFNERLFSCSKPLRAFEMGQDRYKRRYWVLSNLGGIYVEGLESGGWYDNDEYKDPKSEEEEEEEEEDKDVAKDEETKTPDPPSDPIQDKVVNRNVSSIDAAPPDSNPARGASPKSTDPHLSPESGYSGSHVKDVSCTGEEQETKQGTLLQDEPEIVPPVTTSISSSINSSNIPSGAADSDVSALSSSVSTDTCSVNQYTNATDALTEHSSHGKEALDLNDSVKTDFSSPENSVLSSPTSTDVGKSKSCERISSDHISPPATSAAIVVAPQDSAIATSTDIALPSPTNPQHASLNATPADYSIVEKDAEEDSSESNTESKTTVEHTSVEKQTPSEDAPSALPQHPGHLGKNGKDDCKIEEDEVEAAARAIAAKAVASTSHLLYPQLKALGSASPTIQVSTSNENLPSAKLDTFADLPKRPEMQSTLPVTINNSCEVVPGIGKHLSQALESLGVDANNLSQQQVLALFKNTEKHEDIKINPIANENFLPMSTNSELASSNTSVLVHSGQDAPMDLSKPSINSSCSFDSSKATTFSMFPTIKSEPPMFDFPFYRQDSPSLYGGVHSMIPFHPSIKTEMNRINYGSPEPPDAKANDVCKDVAPIPEDVKSGWWRISTEEKFDDFCRSLHCRGMREKHLHRVATKHRKYCLQAMERANGPEFQFSDTSNSKEKEDKINDDDNSTDQEEEGPFEDTSETAFLIEMELLRQVEELIERCKAAGVLHENLESLPKSNERQNELAHVPYHDDVTDDLRHDWLNPIRHDPSSALGFAVELVRKLELSLMRVYLKPPLVRKGGATEFSNLPSFSDSGALDVAAGLKTWRNAVATATSAAQLSMCVSMLDSCIHWQRAPKFLSKSESSPRTKRKKRERKSGGKSPGSSSGKKKKKQVESGMESEDSMSNIRTQTDNVEESSRDSKLSADRKSENHDLSNSNADHALLPSDEDTRMHQDEDASTDGAVWPSEKDPLGTCDDELTETSESVREEEVVKKKKRKRNPDKPKRRKTLLSSCKDVLRALQGHEMATWFLFPVDLKVVPDYRKIIKRPMDFKTIEMRLKRKKYKLAAEFVDDVRTVFDNCRVFNEDESPIGNAGHTLRSLFENRWSLVQSSMDLQEPIG